jgi:hypothetical protein
VVFGGLQQPCRTVRRRCLVLLCQTHTQADICVCSVHCGWCVCLCVPPSDTLPVPNKDVLPGTLGPALASCCACDGLHHSIVYPWLASVGLDRFLRVQDTSSKGSKIRVYLKQQLTSVAWLPPVAVQQQQSSQAAAEGSAQALNALVSQEPEEGSSRGVQEGGTHGFARYSNCTVLYCTRASP